MKLNVYQIVTDRIVKQLETGIVPWRRPWGGEEGRPQNANSRKPYRGINAILLGCSAFDSPYWLSFRQAQLWGGHVKKGEQGTPVVYWNRFRREDEETGKSEVIPFLKYYTVFNVEQCEGLPSAVVAKPAPRLDFHPIEVCEQVVENLPAGHSEIVHRGNQACYFPSLDRVQMPKQEQFDSAEDYYGVLFHELTHSTGHASRLNRKGVAEHAAPFGSPVYSYEELVAEMGSAFLCGQTGIDVPAVQRNQAAYLGGWLAKLKAEPKLVVQAAGAAQKAADWLLGIRLEDAGEIESAAVAA